jgi:hypothetical protein
VVAIDVEVVDTVVVLVPVVVVPLAVVIVLAKFTPKKLDAKSPSLPVIVTR